MSAKGRLPLPPPEQMSDAQQQIYDSIASGPRGGVGGPFPALLRSPQLCDRVQRLGEYCRFDTSLAPRLNELAILINARHWESKYEWWAHRRLATRAGLPEPIIEAVLKQEGPGDMTVEEAVIHDFCTALHRTHAVDDATYARAVQAFGERGVLDLIGVSGYYTLVSMVLNVAEVPLPDGVPSPW